jgi:two-component system, NarL family, nitrate/nitrite response regulator NarL
MNTKGSTQRVRVLIADDDPIVRNVVRAHLASQPNVEVVGEAADGRQAVKMASELTPDLLILDLLMPNLPGLDTLRELTTSDVRTVLLCSTLTKRQILEALQLGARGILLKQQVSELLPAIRAVIDGQYWVGGKSVSNVLQIVSGLATEVSVSPSKSNFGLTDRELEVVNLVTQGLTNREIATNLRISEETVKRHLTNIFDKVGMSSRLELALFALDHRLVARQ